MGWFSDFFASRVRKRDVSCSFCMRSCLDAGPLVEGPSEVFICSACGDAASTSLDKATGQGRCSFCRKDSTDVGPLVQAETGVRICADCVDLVRQILKQEALRRENLKPHR